MTFRPGDAVKTPHGIGHIIDTYNGIHVMINNYPKGKNTYCGEYQHPYHEKSPTVSRTYQESEVEPL